MKLPAQIVKSWNDLRLNFDALAKQVTPYTFAAVVGGGWSAAVPGPTTGIAFTLPKAGPTLIFCDATAYSTVAGQIAVEVYLDGVWVGQHMLLQPATSSPAAHARLGPCAFSRNLSRGTHYVAFRQIAGNSDSGDYGNIAVVQP